MSAQLVIWKLVFSSVLLFPPVSSLSVHLQKVAWDTDSGSLEDDRVDLPIRKY